MARPQDIGQQFPSDAAASVQPNKNANRTQADYGTRNENNEAFVPTELSSSEGISATTFGMVVQTQLDNVLTVRHPDDPDTLIFIAKPPHLRKENNDTEGEENDAGEIIEYGIDGIQGTRKRTLSSNGGTIDLLEVIEPQYTVEDLIFIAQVDDSGLTAVTLQDLNLAARRWVSSEPLYKHFVITDFNRDTFECQEWDFTLNAGAGGQKLGPDGEVLPAVQVAKTYDVRGTSWSKDVPEPEGPGLTQTPDGARYTTVGATDETGPHIERAGFRSESFPTPNTDEQQEITPPWFDASEGVWATIIRSVRVDTGTGAFFEGVQSIWQDTNEGGHAFAEKFA